MSCTKSFTIAFKVRISSIRPKIKIINENFKIFFLNPDRAWLYQRCNSRFIQMLQNGAIDEVKYLKSNNASGGVTKAIGYKQISDWIDNQITNKEMIIKATQETRHYAKRQITWFKNQFKNAITFTPENADNILKEYF